MITHGPCAQARRRCRPARSPVRTLTPRGHLYSRPAAWLPGVDQGGADVWWPRWCRARACRTPAHRRKNPCPSAPSTTMLPYTKPAVAHASVSSPPPLHGPPAAMMMQDGPSASTGRGRPNAPSWRGSTTGFRAKSRAGKGRSAAGFSCVVHIPTPAREYAIFNLRIGYTDRPRKALGHAPPP